MGLFSKKQDEKQNDGQSKSEADALVEKLGASIEEKFGKKFEAVDTLLAKWNKMEQEAAESLNDEARRSAKAAEESLTPEEKLANENKKLFLLQVLTNARITEQECIDEVKGQWPGLVPRIREVLATIPMDDKAKGDYPQRCRNAVKLVVGDEAIKNGLRQDRNSGKFMIEDSVAKTGGEESPLNDSDLTWIDPRNPDRPPMTATQQLAKLKIDPKEFADWAKKQGMIV
jgi:hypothetical protein